MGKFLIDTMPIDAVYLPRDKFVNDLDESTLINTVQMVDPRFTLEDITGIEKSASPPELARFLEIAEKIESGKRAECLHGFSLFKMETTPTGPDKSRSRGESVYLFLGLTINLCFPVLLDGGG